MIIWWRQRKWVVGLVLLALAVGACNGQTSSPAESPSKGDVAPPAPTATQAVPAVDEPTEIEQAQTKPTDAGEEKAMPEEVVDTPAASPTEVAFVPSDRLGFTPTSPSTVNLASGQLQFVEFFAFW